MVLFHFKVYCQFHLCHHQKPILIKSSAKGHPGELICRTQWCISFRHRKRGLVYLKVCCLSAFSVSKRLTLCVLCCPIWWQAYPCSSDKECEVGRYCHSPHQGSSACMVCRRKKKRCHRDGMCCPGTRCNNGKSSHQVLTVLFILGTPFPPISHSFS